MEKMITIHPVVRGESDSLIVRKKIIEVDGITSIIEGEKIISDFFSQEAIESLEKHAGKMAKHFSIIEMHENAFEVIESVPAILAKILF